VRAIYNRARAAQSEQLGKPPFNKADLDRERSMLEDAISRVGNPRLHDLNVFSAGFVLGMLGMYIAAWLYGYHQVAIH
jgi:hypothetical protein